MLARIYIYDTESKALFPYNALVEYTFRKYFLLYMNATSASELIFICLFFFRM